MKNLIFKTLVDGYNEISFTHNYIFGFIDRGNVYMTKTKSDTLPFITCLDKVASNRGGGYSLRFKPNKAQKEILKTYDLEILCSADFFKREVSESIYNKGEIFEKLVTEFYGQKWEKDDIPFTIAGDLIIKNVSYQIKFENATFCTEKSLANLRKRG